MINERNGEERDDGEVVVVVEEEESKKHSKKSDIDLEGPQKNSISDREDEKNLDQASQNVSDDSKEEKEE